MTFARSYPLAQAALSSLMAQTSPNALSRPPPRMAAVRAGLTRPQRPAAPPQATLESMADAAVLRAEPNGVFAWQLALDDSLLGTLACRIALGPQGIEATFYAHDVATERLLSSEAGRLRAHFVERGLKVADIKVLLGDDPDAL